MSKIINLFNHKGGVSKTTTVFNLAWMLGTMGKKVIVADFDPQCNLTGMVLGYKGVEDLEGAYREDPPNNIKDALSPAFESKPRQITGAECITVPGNDNLLLLPGHIGLAEYETTLGIAQELSGSLLALKNLPGSIRFMLTATADKYKADYVFVDMSPSLGPINQNLLMTMSSGGARGPGWRGDQARFVHSGREGPRGRQRKVVWRLCSRFYVAIS